MADRQDDHGGDDAGTADKPANAASRRALLKAGAGLAGAAAAVTTVGLTAPAFAQPAGDATRRGYAGWWKKRATE